MYHIHGTALETFALLITIFYYYGLVMDCQLKTIGYLHIFKKLDRMLLFSIKKFGLKLRTLQYMLNSCNL